MSAFSDTQGFANARAAEAKARREGFWAQTPAAVLAIAAVVAIVFVNGPDRHGPDKHGPDQHAPSTTSRTAVPAATTSSAASKPAAAPITADCPDCATVLSVQQLLGTGDSGFAVEVKMKDGTRRTVRQFAAGFEVGDIVVVNGNALTLRQ